MPQASSSRNPRKSAPNAKTLGGLPSPNASRQNAKKKSAASERLVRAVSKTPAARVVPVPSSSCAPRKPADVDAAPTGPRQLWLMKTDPDYMASARPALSCSASHYAPHDAFERFILLFTHHDMKLLRWTSSSEILRRYGPAFEAMRCAAGRCPFLSLSPPRT